MADFDKVIEELKSKFAKKKAKVKALKVEPTGTKSQSLPAGLVKAFKTEFSSADFSKVKIHTGGNAAEACKSLGAKAFAQGTDIYLAKPSSANDAKFLGHELWHVVQQGNGRIKAAGNGKALVSK